MAVAAGEPEAGHALAQAALFKKISLKTTLVNSGFWKMAHEARTDLSIVLGAVFRLIAGAGAWSLDALMFKSAGRGQQAERPSSEDRH